MTIHFIGAGPGAADLLTLRAARLVETCPVCLHAGALVSPQVLALARGETIDTQGLDLDAITAHLARAHAAGQGRRPAPFRRRLVLFRRGRADGPSGRARHSARDGARRAGLRGGGGGARPAAHPARAGAERHARAVVRERDARRQNRGPRLARPHRRDDVHPPRPHGARAHRRRAAGPCWGRTARRPSSPAPRCPARRCGRDASAISRRWRTASGGRC